MKNIASVLSVFVVLLFSSCQGPQGPPGFNGFDGQNGVNFVGQSFERTIDLVAANGFQETVVVPLNIEVLETDMVLTYLFRGQLDGLDVWQLLPQTVYTNTGEEFQYNFEHNFDQVTIFIDGPSTLNLNSLGPVFTQNLTFRVVILPVDFVNNRNIDTNNFNSFSSIIKTE